MKETMEDIKMFSGFPSAHLTVTGNSAKGYYVKLMLPSGFLEVFDYEQKLMIMGEYVNKNWGASADAREIRVKGQNILDTRETALAYAGKVVNEVTEAAITCRDIIAGEVSESIHIPL